MHSWCDSFTSCMLFSVEFQETVFPVLQDSIKSHHSSPHLAQLLLRVDYNKYFSTQNPLVSTTLGILNI